MIIIESGAENLSWIEQGDCAYNQKNYTKAIYAYGVGLKADSTNVELLSKTGNAYFCLELYDAAETFYWESLTQSNSIHLIYEYCLDTSPDRNIITLQETLQSQYDISITVEGLEYIVDTIRKDREHMPSQQKRRSYPPPWEYQIVNFIRHIVPFPTKLLDLVHHMKHSTSLLTNENHQLTLSKRMSWMQFEEFVYQLFKNKGYQVTKTQKTHDQGVDLLLRNDDESIAIQIKKRTKPTGVRGVQEIHTGRAFYGTHRAVLISANGFTESALELANKVNVECWDWERLLIELQNNSISNP